MQEPAFDRPRTARTGSLRRDLLLGAVAGLAATAVAGRLDRRLARMGSRRQRWKERLLRGGSPHTRAGPRAASQLLGRRPSAQEARAARLAFSTLYGVGWGLLYTGIRSAVPAAGRLGGLPFAVPFYLLCDGVLAPRLGLSKPPRRLPLRSNARELANHVAWTATAEVAHRAVRRMRR